MTIQQRSSQRIRDRMMRERSQNETAVEAAIRLRQRALREIAERDEEQREEREVNEELDRADAIELEQKSPLEQLEAFRKRWAAAIVTGHLQLQWCGKIEYLLAVQEEELEKEKSEEVRGFSFGRWKELDDLGMNAEEREFFEKMCQQLGENIDEERQKLLEEIRDRRCKGDYKCSQPDSEKALPVWHPVRGPLLLQEHCLNCLARHPSFGAPCGHVTLCGLCANAYVWNRLRAKSWATCWICRHPTPFFKCLL